MKKIVFYLVTSILNIIPGEITHVSLMAKTENMPLKTSYTLGNKVFSAEQFEHFSSKDQAFLSKVNEYSNSIYMSGLTPQIIKQEDYSELKKTCVDIRKQLIIKIKSEKRTLYHHFPGTSKEDQNDSSCELSCGTWCRNGFIAGSCVGCVSFCIIAYSFSGVAGCFALIPLPFPLIGGTSAEFCNRLQYRFFVEEKQIRFDEHGKELE